MNQCLPQELDSKSLSQLSKEKLVDMIIEQSKALCELQKIILELQQEVERLKVSRDRDSKISSKPPSGNILKSRKIIKRLKKENQISPKENQVDSQDIKERPVKVLGE